MIWLHTQQFTERMPFYFESFCHFDEVLWMDKGGFIIVVPLTKPTQQFGRMSHGGVQNCPRSKQVAESLTHAKPGLVTDLAGW